MEKRRVVITGLGIVSPLGIGQKTYWDHVRDPKHLCPYSWGDRDRQGHDCADDP